MNGIPLDHRNMNGLTSQDAVQAIGGSGYDMVLIACARARELRKNHAAKIISHDSTAVTALLEIEQKKVGLEYLPRVAVRSTHD